MAMGPSNTTIGASALGTEESCTVTALSLSVGRLAGVFRTFPELRNYPLNLNQVMLAEEVRDGKDISMPCH
jgi:hypothetical protein